MKLFVETETAKRIMDEFVRASKMYEEQEMTDDERAVKEQKTLLQKFYCRIIYGHLEKKGVCLRCGAALKK